MEELRYMDRNKESNRESDKVSNKASNKVSNGIENIAAYALDDYIKKYNDSCVLIDVRDKNKYDDRHIDGAINISYRDIQTGKFNIDKDKIIILYCDRGGLSMTAAKYLSRQGYKVKNVVGGLKNYLMGKNSSLKK